MSSKKDLYQNQSGYSNLTSFKKNKLDDLVNYTGEIKH